MAPAGTCLVYCLSKSEVSVESTMPRRRAMAWRGVVVGLGLVELHAGLGWAGLGDDRGKR